VANNLNFPNVDLLIAQNEGYGTYQAPSITYGNNPGAIMYGPFAQSLGATGANDNGTAIFPDHQTGMNALDTLVSQKIGGGLNTPAALINSWAPANAPGNSQAATDNYIQSVAAGLGIGANDPIPSTTAAANTPWWNKSFGELFGTRPAGSTVNPFTGLTHAAEAGGAKSSGIFGGFPSFAQIAAFVIGAGLIIGGIFFLRPVQSATVQIAGAARKAGTIISG